jgi:phosphatidylglycerol lysyltransferase
MQNTLSPIARKRLGRVVGVVVALIFAALAVRVLRAELQPEVWARLPVALEALPLWRVVAAVVVVVVVYCWLGWFDRLGFLVVRQSIGTGFAVRTGFMAYAIVHNLGFALFTGTAFRAHRYGGSGTATSTIARVYGSNIVTMWLGYGVALGVALLVRPPAALHAGAALERIIGALLLAVVVAYVVVAVVGVRPLRVRRLAVAVPGAALAILQVFSGALHWTLSAVVLWLVLPDGPGLVDVVGALCLAQIVAALSHIPGGVGVLEGTLLLLLGGEGGLDRTGVVAGVLLFRAVYFLLPFALTLVMLVVGRVVVTIAKRAAPSGSARPPRRGSRALARRASCRTGRRRTSPRGRR